MLTPFLLISQIPQLNRIQIPRLSPSCYELSIEILQTTKLQHCKAPQHTPSTQKLHSIIFIGTARCCCVNNLVVAGVQFVKGKQERKRDQFGNSRERETTEKRQTCQKTRQT